MRLSSGNRELCWGSDLDRVKLGRVFDPAMTVRDADVVPVAPMAPICFESRSTMRSKYGYTSTLVVSTIAFALVTCLAPAPLQGQSVPNDDQGERTSEAESKGASSSGTSTGSDDTNRSLRSQLERLLSGYHYQPDRDDLRALGASSKVEAALTAIIDDRALRSSMRLRAVDTLALYEGEEVVSFLDDLLTRTSRREASDEQTASLLRHRAIMGLARVLPDHDAVERLEAFLDDDELQLRLTTIAALGQHAGDPGLRRLRQLAQEVEHDVVRSELERYIDLEKDTSE